ncbi:hypothetical protein K7432_010381 [Basidiobolus ranarum]|uniref:Uncharacterized protein n=1 Tax=Basidiobolus ranarum TaxID=34480 RepID=A0ABR2WNW1_9FUNG
MKNSQEKSEIHISQGGDFRTKVSKFLLDPISSIHVALIVLIFTYYFKPLEKNSSPKAQDAQLLVLNSVWAGFLLAISFMEAWVKFCAPTQIRVRTLDIGRHVFSALNKVEVVFSVLIGFNCVRQGSFFAQLVGPLVVLTVQSVWLLPSLIHHADCLLTGKPVPGNTHHVMYVLLEVVKVITFSYCISVYYTRLTS